MRADALAEVTDLDVDIQKEGAACPSSHDHDFQGTLWPDRVSWKTLTVWSGCPPLCVIISVSVRQSKVCLPLVNLLSFVR